MCVIFENLSIICHTYYISLMVVIGDVTSVTDRWTVLYSQYSGVSMFILSDPQNARAFLGNNKLLGGD